MDLETSRTYRWPLFLFVAGAMMWTGLPEASAQEEREEFEDTIHIIQKKPVLVGGRFELTPQFGVTINDSVYRRFKTGANATYHITERIHVGGLFDWYDFGETLGGRTNVFDKTFKQTRTAADAPVVNWFGALEGGYTPIYGKFTLFNLAIIYYDISASLGVGAINSESLVQPEPSTGFAATGSLQSHLYISDWMALNVRVRDVLFPSTLTGPNGQSNQISNLVTVSAGVSLYFPTSFEYSEGDTNQ